MRMTKSGRCCRELPLRRLTGINLLPQLQICFVNVTFSTRTMSRFIDLIGATGEENQTTRPFPHTTITQTLTIYNFISYRVSRKCAKLMLASSIANNLSEALPRWLVSRSYTGAWGRSSIGLLYMSVTKGVSPAVG